MAAGIYSITHVSSGRMYIGSSTRIHFRWNQHRASLNRGDHHSKYLQRVWDKYGSDAFKFQIERECSVSELELLEQEYIDTYQPEFNTCPVSGTTRGIKHSEEHKRKISEASRKMWAERKEEILAKRPPVSEETRQKMSRSQKGLKKRPHTEEFKRRMSEVRKGKPSINKGRKFPPEFGEQISKRKKGKPVPQSFKDRWNPENTLGEKGSFYGKKHTEEAKMKISAANKGRSRGPQSEETKKKSSEALKKAWQRRKQK